MKSILDYFPNLVVDPQLHLTFPTAKYINGFDHRLHAVMVKSRKDEERHLANMMWGFLPDHVKNWDEAQRFWNGYKNEQGKWIKGYITLNAVGEEILEKKTYRDAALNRRCVIFTDGFYEWHHFFPLNKKTGEPLKTAIKFPYHIRMKDQGSPIMMAGIWNPWKHTEVDKQTGEVESLTTPTFAICTSSAKNHQIMSQVHNSKLRMPTILTKQLAEEWISDGLTEERIKAIATNVYPSELMEAFTIPKDFQQNCDPKQMYTYEEVDAVLC